MGSAINLAKATVIPVFQYETDSYKQMHMSEMEDESIQRAFLLIIKLLTSNIHILNMESVIMYSNFIIHFIGTEDMCSNQFTNNIKTYNILYCKFHMAN
jgi:hypothetical protein